MSCKDHVVTGDLFQLWQCDACNFRFIQNAPPGNAIGRYYDSHKYMSHSITGGGLFNNIYQKARKYSVWWRCKIVIRASRKRTGTLLDIGSGVGAFADAMKKNSWEVTALEPDENARKSAATQYGLEVQSMDRLYQLQTQSFDVITLWHVLEHVHDIHGYMSQVDRLLKNDGTLVMAVPNFTSSDALHYGEFWDGYDVPRHLFHFSPASMERIHASHGFNIVKKEMFWMDAYYACLMSEQHRSGKKKWIAATWNGFMSNIRAIGNINKSSAIAYTGKKK